MAEVNSSLIFETILLVVGMIFFILSSFDTKKMESLDPIKKKQSSWPILKMLEVFFFIGYTLAIFDRWNANFDFFSKIVTSIFAGGAIFVWLSKKLSTNLAKELHTINEELETIVDKRTKDLIQATKMAGLGEMAAGVAHEINTPLSSIALCTQKILRKLEKNELNIEEYKKSVLIIQETTKHISEIVKGLRQFSHDDSQEEMQEIPFCDLVYKTLSFCEERFKNANIEIKKDPNPCQSHIYCHPSELAQVFLHVLNNAYDAIKSLPSAWVELKCEHDNKYVRLYISDNGPGIPKENADKIMQPFYTTKEVGSGTGLGLSISKGIIEKHGGSLALDSEAKHTTFIIELPLKGYQND